MKTPREVSQADDVAERLAAYREELLYFLKLRTESEQDAEDICQQAILQAIVARENCRGTNLRAWLFTIARNLIVDLMRRRGRCEFVAVEDIPDAALPAQPNLVRRICESRERLRGCMTFIGRVLPLEEHAAVLLSDIYGYKDKEAASELQLPLPTFKLLLHQGRQRLQASARGACLKCPLIMGRRPSGALETWPECDSLNPEQTIRPANGFHGHRNGGLSRTALRARLRRLLEGLDF